MRALRKISREDNLRRAIGRIHHHRYVPARHEWPRYVATEFAVRQFHDLYPDQDVAERPRRSYTDIDGLSWKLRKLWIKRGRFFSRTRRGDKIIVCRPPKSDRRIYILVRPGQEKSGIIRVLTEREARGMSRETRRHRHR